MSVADLAERFGVNAMTIRRDLHQFEDQGILEMHYGGARLRQTKPPFEEFARREEIHRAKKRAIAKAAAALIREGDVLFLDVSTTVLSVIDYLPDDEEIEAAIKRTVLAQSDHTWLLIDDSKMKGHTFIKISDVSAYDSILTNVSLDQNLQSDYKEKGARLTLC